MYLCINWFKVSIFIKVVIFLKVEKFKWKTRCIFSFPFSYVNNECLLSIFFPSFSSLSFPLISFFSLQNYYPNIMLWPCKLVNITSNFCENKESFSHPTQYLDERIWKKRKEMVMKKHFPHLDTNKMGGEENGKKSLIFCINPSNIKKIEKKNLLNLSTFYCQLTNSW